MKRTLPIRAFHSSFGLALSLSVALAPAALTACGGVEPGPAPAVAGGAPTEAPAESPVAPSTLGRPSPLLQDHWSSTPACVAPPCTAHAVPGARSSRSRVSLAAGGKKTHSMNSQLPGPHNLTLADVNGDGLTDFLQISSNKLFASNVDYDRTGILHLYASRPIKRLLTGDFHGDGYDQTCLVLDNNALECYGISTNGDELWWWFTQGSFLADNEDAIVGDFDGDGRDDVFVYNRASGAVRMYTMKGDFFLGAMTSFAPGNLSGAAVPGMQFRAGDFNGDGREDLIAINGARQIISYASVNDGTNDTFWWAFTTNGGFVGPNDQVTVARIDDDTTDDVVLHDRVAGTTRFFHDVYVSGNLEPITSVNRGQLDTNGNTLLFWGAVHGSISETGSANRDDALMYEYGTNFFVRTDARFDGSALTYWWSYSQFAPGNDVGWVPFTDKRWLVIKCKFSDQPQEPQTTAFFRNLFVNRGSGGMVDYWRDLSYGSWDLGASRLDDAWYTMTTTTLAGAGSISRQAKAQRCIDASGISTAGYTNVVALINAVIDSGTQGYVLLDPGAWNVTFAGHEMGHGMGWDHSFDDTSRKVIDWAAPGEYWDLWDIMSAMNVYTFTSPLGVTAGPEMNAPYRTKQSFIPAQRMVRLVPTGSPQSATIRLAALNRPEADGAMMVRIGNNDSDYYTVEFRKQTGWDQGIPQDAVLLHRVRNGTSYLITAGGGPERLVGSSYTVPGGLTLAVNSFGAGYTASVTVTY